MHNITQILFEQNPSPMYIYEVKTLRFLAANKAACKKYGYSETEFKKSDILLIRPEAEYDKILENVLDEKKQSESYQVDTIHQTKDGKGFHVRVVSFLFSYNGITARLVQVTDIEDYYQEKIKNIQLLHKLKRQLKFLQHLGWVQSHQLRSKAANIMGLLEVQKHGYFKNEEEASVFELLRNESTKLDGLIRNIAIKINDYTKVD